MASHRGAHPEDHQQFGPNQTSRLRAVVHDLAWLRSRGYGDDSALELVGNRYRLKRRQRNAVARSACSVEERSHRTARCREASTLTDRWIIVDGFNVLISVEGLLGGAYLFIGRDRAYRDVNPVQGTYRLVKETTPAIEAIGTAMVDLDVEGLTWLLDDDVSNVGRVKDRMEDLAPAQIGWRVLNRGDVDAELARSKQVVATSDSVVLDHVDSWCSIERIVHNRMSDDNPHVIDLRVPVDCPNSGASESGETPLN
ncbi:MAG: DUF434 domain-containing protein [Bacteroidetes bacterium QH_7_62_13]|nr:MAG: DUF434 domain-containing protein [Bacteroidetes bacterium QH_7_62_13]